MLSNNGKVAEIRRLEDKYGLALFRMGLTHLVDVGVRHLDDAIVQENIMQIMADGEAGRSDGTVPIMTPEFKRGIILCAAELAKFSIWQIFAYIKDYVAISHQGGTEP
jgi:hypothetical protein